MLVGARSRILRRPPLSLLRVIAGLVPAIQGEPSLTPDCLALDHRNKSGDDTELDDTELDDMELDDMELDDTELEERGDDKGRRRGAAF